METTLPTRSQPASAKWITGRVQTLLSHYYQPDTPDDVRFAALGDWVKALSGFSSEQIEWACGQYLRSQPSRRPTPADVCNRIAAQAEASGGNKKQDGLSRDDFRILHEQILPTARRWLHMGEPFAQHARKTLEYWGEVTE